jgi:hypothetical protein
VLADSGSPDSSQGTGTPDTSAPAPPGSCLNPQCSTDDQGDCFCLATGDDGQNYQLGCNPDGDCACFLNDNISNSNVEEPGVCNDLAAASQLFIQSCGCP